MRVYAYRALQLLQGPFFIFRVLAKLPIFLIVTVEKESGYV